MPASHPQQNSPHQSASFVDTRFVKLPLADENPSLVAKIRVSICSGMEKGLPYPKETDEYVTVRLAFEMLSRLLKFPMAAAG